ATSVTIYINGVAGTPVTPSGSIPNTTGVLTMGARVNNTLWFGGRLCMWAIWEFGGPTSSDINEVVNLGSFLKQLPSPRTWNVTRSVTSVINHWLVAGNVFTDSGSISTYGRRSYDADDSNSTDIATDLYPSALRTAMAAPRPIITAT